jgi:dihydropteroate synthase
VTNEIEILLAAAKIMPITSSVFQTKLTLNCRGKLLDLSTPKVMGILNVTPDSFYDNGQHYSIDAAVEHGLKMAGEGAAIIDIGGQSTRPKSERITAEEEWSRVEPVLTQLSKRLGGDIFISIDTYHSLVAQRAIESGATIINDVSAGLFDANIFNVAAIHNAPYVLMHMQGTPENMQIDPKYNDVLYDVTCFLRDKIELLHQAGVYDIIIDPGFGFGKNVEHNFTLLKHLNAFRLLGYPILAGLSRKSMINKVLNTKAVDALNGTTALNVLALQNGASVLRVHDVREAVEAVKLWLQYDAAV